MVGFWVNRLANGISRFGVGGTVCRTEKIENFISSGEAIGVGV